MSTEKRFKWSVAVSTILLFVLLLMTAKGFAQNVDEAYRTESFKVNGNVNLEVQTFGGSIKVIGSNGNEVEVEMYVRKRGRYIYAGDADLRDYEIDIEKNGNTVSAIAKRKSSSGWNWNKEGYSISFVVYTPHNTRTRLKTSGGSVSASNLNGTQELRTSGGSVSIDEVTGDMALRTSGGSVKIQNASGNIDARTSGGSIRAETASGDLNLRTSGGSITLKTTDGNVDARTSGGSIKAEVEKPNEHIKLRTSGGNISLTVPSDKGYDLDLDGNRVNVELKNFSGRAERDEIRGTFNGGGIEISAKTSGGSVTLKYF